MSEIELVTQVVVAVVVLQSGQEPEEIATVVVVGEIKALVVIKVDGHWVEMTSIMVKVSVRVKERVSVRVSVLVKETVAVSVIA